MLARIGVEDIQEATARLMRYKQGKAVLDSGIAGNEEWWKLRHWEEMAGRPASARKYARPGGVAVQYAAEQARGRHGQLSRAGGAPRSPGR